MFPMEWATESSLVHSLDLPGRLAFGSPMLLEEDLLLLVLQGKGIEVTVLHLDLTSGDVRRVALFNKGAQRGDFHEVTFRRAGGKLIGQFVVLGDVHDRGSSIEGKAIFGAVDMKTGETKTELVRRVSLNGQSGLMKRLMQGAILDDENSEIAELVTGTKAWTHAQKKLGAIDLELDSAYRQISLRTDIKREWEGTFIQSENE